MKTPAILAALGVLLNPFGPVAWAEDVTAGNTTVTVSKGGSGFIDSIRFQGRRREIVKAKAGFVGASVALAPAGRGAAESLFAHEAPTTLPAVITDIRVEKDSIVVRGSYASGELRIPFTRRIEVVGAQDTIAVREEADFRTLEPKQTIAKYSLDLPLVLDEDPHLRMFAFGGAHRAELFRMDMNDINRGGKQLISAPRGHWPYWDVAGVLQLAGSYRIWKANHADTLAYPIEEGSGAPGWADYSQPQWGITAVVENPTKAAPWAITIDARKGVFSLAPHPASQMPAAGKDYGKRVFAFQLILHQTSWPATIRCELDFALYEVLLKDIIRGRDRPQPYVLYGPIGTADIDTIIHRERIQPSVILRTLYRGDAWRMRGRMKTIGRDGPRNQPMAKWEQEAKAYLDYIRRNGLPRSGRR